jgi:hypothetical protein
MYKGLKILSACIDSIVIFPPYAGYYKIVIFMAKQGT